MEYLASSPLISVPAAATGVAYLNGRWGVSQDWNIISSLIRTRISVFRRLRRNRVNGFYLLEEHAQSNTIADKACLVYEGRTWTFRQVYDTTLHYAGYLHSTLQIKPKEIVAIDFMNSPTFLFLTMAIWSLGATPAYINYNLTGAPLIHSVRTSTARVLLVDPEVRNKLTPEVSSTFSSPTFRDAGGALDVVILDDSLRSSLDYFPPYRAPDAARSCVALREVGVLISTSGTTGMPKSAIVPWDRVMTGGFFASRWMGLRSVTSKHPDRFYTCMPLYHSTAFVLGYMLCMCSTTTFVLGHRFSATHFWSDVRRGDATVIQYVGETLRYLIAQPANPSEDRRHRVRMAFGNGLRPDVWENFKTRFGVTTIAEFYGATESFAATWNLSSNDFSRGAIGRSGALLQLLLRGESAIVEVDWATESPARDPTTGFCTRVPPGSPGELLFALNVKDVRDRFQGYMNNPKATESKILRDVLKRGDAYLRTGDVIRLDPATGLMWFSDRIGDTFRWRSENVSTSEVSEVLGRHPAVLEANVYGVSVPGHEGRAGCAGCLFTSPAGPTPQDLESLAAHAAAALPKAAVPVFIRRLGHTQATGTNKQQKQGLRAQGIDLDKIAADAKDAGDPAPDQIFWLRGGTYVPFTHADGEKIKAGAVRL